MTLVGHDSQVAAFREAMADGRMHQAWLLVGPEGIGKARFAEAAARRLLADAAGPRVTSPALDTPADHPAVRLIESGAHPDFIRLARLENDKTGALARSVTVDQVRGLQRLFGTTPALSEWRVVLVDAIDDLERPAANALLKNLEEPPAKTVFLLVCHAPGRLLPTIRSRCRMLRFSPLGQGDVRRVLDELLPDADRAERDSLVATSEGAPGTALRFAGLDIAALDDTATRLMVRGDPTNAERAALARTLSGRTAQPRYEAFLSRVPSLIARHARNQAGDALAETLALWEKARALAESAVRLSLDPQSVVFELAGMLATLAPPERERVHG